MVDNGDIMGFNGSFLEDILYWFAWGSRWVILPTMVKL